MKVITARNVHVAFPMALQLLNQEGVQRDSRNGQVLLGPSVSTVYEQPIERVMFWPARDANPFYHLYESLWMLAGRNDITHLAHYAKNVVNYSDDGKTWHGAYGHRWRKAFGTAKSDGWPADQLALIAKELRDNPDSRRCVLQIWQSMQDLGRDGKDLPCNVTATLQRGPLGELNLAVFCRSNDIVWGCYGANAVHFSFLLEYMAHWIGCPIGTYTQISVNWHAYLNTLEQVRSIRPDRVGHIYNPYSTVPSQVSPIPMSADGDHERIDDLIECLLDDADDGFGSGSDGPDRNTEPWSWMVYCMLKAHHAYRNCEGIDRYNEALAILAEGQPNNDWITAGRQWMERRKRAFQMKGQLLSGDFEHP